MLQLGSDTALLSHMAAWQQVKWRHVRSTGDPSTGSALKSAPDGCFIAAKVQAYEIIEIEEEVGEWCLVHCREFVGSSSWPMLDRSIGSKTRSRCC